MTLVTIHLAPGQTQQQLVRAIKLLNGGAQIRTVSGRFGVLVDAELAYQYLAVQFAPLPVVQESIAEVVASKPKAKTIKAAKATPKAVKAAADSNEEV